MNEEQRAVLAAVGRMEQGSGTLIDEYTVAKEAGVVRGDLPSQEYVHSQERAQIRHLLEELERGGMIRLSREGYWRPRTTLVGRRAWQDPHASLLPPTVVTPPEPQPTRRGGAAPIPDIFGDDDEPREPRWATQRTDRDPETEPEEQPRRRAWPAWWPAALRVGDPGRTPLIAGAAAALLALLLVIVVATRVAGGRGPDPTPTISAVAQTATTFAALPSPTPPTAGGGTQPSAAASAASPTAPASTRPSSNGAGEPTQTRPPTATAGPPAAQVRIANTDLQGAFLYATPAGERTTLAVPEGTLVEVAGPDERDTQGRNWKQIYWANDVYWILEEYTTPAE
jgi:hypothetical protein